MISHSIASLYEYITACARQALQGQIPSPLRRYSFWFDEDEKRIVFKAEVEKDLSEDERESLAVAETEVYADSIFGDDTEIKTMIEIIPTEVPLHPLPNGVVFLRDGEASPQAV